MDDPTKHWQHKKCAIPVFDSQTALEKLGNFCVEMGPT